MYKHVAVRDNSDAVRDNSDAFRYLLSHVNMHTNLFINPILVQVLRDKTNGTRSHENFETNKESVESIIHHRFIQHWSKRT